MILHRNLPEKALDNTGYEYSTWRTILDGFPEDELSCDGLIITGGFSMSNYLKEEHYLLEETSFVVLGANSGYLPGNADSGQDRW